MLRIRVQARLLLVAFTGARREIILYRDDVRGGNTGAIAVIVVALLISQRVERAQAQRYAPSVDFGTIQSAEAGVGVGNKVVFTSQRYLAADALLTACGQLALKQKPEEAAA